MRFVRDHLRRLGCAVLAAVPLMGAPSLGEAQLTSANDWSPAAPYSACPVAPLDWFTPAEAWAWEQVCLDRAAYMSAVSEDDPRYDCRVRPEDASPHGAALSPRFLVVVNTQEPFISHIPASYAGFYCARIEGDLTFSYATIPHTLELGGSTVDGSVWLRRSVWEGSFFLGQGIVAGRVNADFAVLDSLVLRGAAIFGDVSAEGLRVKSNLILIEADIYDGCCEDLKAAAVSEGVPPALDASRAEDIWLDQPRRDPEGSVDLHDVAIGGNLALYRARVRGRVNALRIDVGAGVHAYDSILGPVTLSQSTIANDLVLRDSVFPWLNGVSASIGGDARLRRAVAESVTLRDAPIAGNAFFDGASIERLSLERAEVGGSVHLRKGGEGRFGIFRNVNFAGARIGQSLQLYDSFFLGDVDLRRLTVDELLFFQENRVPIWFEESGLALDFAETAVLTARTPDSWLRFGEGALDLSPADGAEATVGGCLYEEQRFVAPAEGEDPDGGALRAEQLADCILNEEPFWGDGPYPFTRALTADGDFDYVPMSLNGFVYQDIDERIDPRFVADGSLEVFDAGAYSAWVSQSGGVYDRKPLSSEDWEEFRRQGSDAESRYTFVETHNPQPFEQLAAFFERRGYQFKADRVRINQNFDRMANTSLTPLGVLSLALSILHFLFTVFGVYPIVTLVWFFLLVLWGASEAGRAGSGLEGAGYRLRFWYSIENALPLVSTSEDFRAARHANERVAAFFHMQKILGFALASIFVGSLALL